MYSSIINEIITQIWNTENVASHFIQSRNGSEMRFLVLFKAEILFGLDNLMSHSSVISFSIFSLIW